MSVIFLSLFGFLLGALPFSVWVGNFGLKKDIRREGDQNPGATNVLRAGGKGWYAFALLLDIGKGALPVGLASYLAGIQGWSLIPIALAPPLGHAFSPLLKFRGGKAVAATFGVWIGLTLWQVPLVSMSLLVLFSLLITPSGWALLLTLIGTTTAIAVWLDNPVFLAIFLLHSLLLVFTHRADLRQKPKLKVASRES